MRTKTPISVINQRRITSAVHQESKEVQVALDLLSMVKHKSLTVEYKERKAFLTPFIPLLINPKGTRTEGCKPLRQAAASTCKLMDADAKRQYAEPDCIEDEIYKLFNELYPKE